jgi:hypothetical protein
VKRPASRNGDDLGNVPREGAHGVEVGASIERGDHLEPPRARRLHERDEAELFEDVSERAGCVANSVQAAARRIEIEDELVGAVELVGPAEPCVRRHHRLVAPVVGGEVRLRNSVSREEDLVRVRDLDIDDGHDRGLSRTT